MESVQTGGHMVRHTDSVRFLLLEFWRKIFLWVKLLIEWAGVRCFMVCCFLVDA